MHAAPQERYAFKPFLGSSHRWALNQLAALPAAARVLDIGPGSGFTGSALCARGLQELYAVEIDAEARKHLAEIYRRVEPDMSAYHGNSFDAVLLLDVLEHMQDPFSFLAAAVPMLSPGGLLLVSVPNVAHWSVRLPLLLGYFEYRSRGILDRTHCQFFTRRRFRRLIEHPELRLCSLASSISPAELALPKTLWDNPLFRTVSRIRMAGASAWPGLLAYQHLAALRRAS